MISLFNVVQFFEDGSSDYIRRNVGPEEAMTVLGDYSRRPAAQIGIIKRLIVTDDDDCCNAEWRFGEGFTYPPELVEAEKLARTKEAAHAKECEAAAMALLRERKRDRRHSRSGANAEASGGAQ